MSTDEHTRIKKAALAEFSAKGGVEGVGIGGANILNVYVMDEATKQRLPETFEGYQVRGIITGRIEGL